MGVRAYVDFRICRLIVIFPKVFSFRLTSFSGAEGLWILRVQLLETLDSITLKLSYVKLFEHTFTDNNRAIVSSRHVCFACWHL